jgi:sugar/nucleoside kinase (ribokinase family)
VNGQADPPDREHEAPARLVSVGNVVIDLIAWIPAVPAAGGDVLASSSEMAPGGGFNVLAAARRQGMRAAYGGAHGTGPFGDLARRALVREGIDVLNPPSPGIDTGYDVALVDDDGERTFITSVGAEATLDREGLDRIRLESDDVVHVSGYSLLGSPRREAIVGWLESIDRRQRVLVDPGPLVGEIPDDVLTGVLSRATWWSCNAREAETLTGSSDPIGAARELSARAPGCGIVVRRGAAGCVVVIDQGAPVAVDGFPVDVVDTNGAGDAHVGAFLAALARGEDPGAAARTANACAAIAVSRRGPATAPTLAEVARFLKTRDA